MFNVLAAKPKTKEPVSSPKETPDLSESKNTEKTVETPSTQGSSVQNDNHTNTSADSIRGYVVCTFNCQLVLLVCITNFAE